MTLALDIFDNFGLNFLVRYAHVLAGITWIGLLYYFNFVQVPAFAALDAGARNQAVDKLASRALWWFRWAAVATFLFGLLIGLIPLVGRRRRRLPHRRLLQECAGHQHLDRHAARHHDVPERLGRHLAQPEEGHRERAQRARGWRGRPDGGRRRPRRAAGLAPERDLLAADAAVHGRHVALLRRRQLHDGQTTAPSTGSSQPSSGSCSSSTASASSAARVRTSPTGSTRTTSARSAVGFLFAIVWYVLWEIIFT